MGGDPGIFADESALVIFTVFGFVFDSKIVGLQENGVEAGAEVGGFEFACFEVIGG